MITTKQVRAIMRQHTTNTYGIYTNKTRAHTGTERRVKCYFRNNTNLLIALQKAAGAENVKVTDGGNGPWAGGPAIVVKCLLD